MGKKSMTIKTSLSYLTACVSAALLALLICNVLVFVTSSHDKNFIIFLITEIVAISLLSALVAFSFLLLRRSVLTPLSSLKDGILELKNGSISHRFNLNGNNEISEIACAFDEITCDLETSNKELALMYDTSRKYFFRTIDALIAAVEAKDKYTEGHSQRVSEYAVSVAQKLDLPKEHVEDIKIAGILHDIGKIGISDSILLKPDKLTVEEYEVIKQHPVISNKILNPVGFSDRTLKAIAFHHERFDGKGYPYGLSGKDMPLEAQIIAVADAFDAMTSNRSYRSALGTDVALNELISNKSTQFNPSIVDCMVDLVKSTNI